MQPESWLQIVISVVGIALGVIVHSLRGKLDNLDKLTHIDGILDQLKNVAERLSALVTRQEVSESLFRLEIQFLKDRQAELERRISALERGPEE
jgi:hypothetical protein